MWDTHICARIHTNTNGCCLLKGFVVCHLFRIAIRFLSISFRSITIPFDLVDITNLLLTGHIIFSSRFVLQQFYYSRYDFYFLHIESENSMVCCVVSFLSFIFLLFFWSGLWSWIVSVHCGHRSLSLYTRLSSSIWVRVFMFVHFSSSTETVFRQAHPQHILFNIIPDVLWRTQIKSQTQIQTQSQWPKRNQNTIACHAICWTLIQSPF